MASIRYAWPGIIAALNTGHSLKRVCECLNADGTALHELAHWSGHPSRLNRATLTESYRFGDISYAKEELRAELASVFLAAERGIPHDREQYASYVGSWIQTLKEDKNEIFRAAHDASRAADFLLALERDRSVNREVLSADPAVLGSAKLGGLRARPAAAPAAAVNHKAVVTIRQTPERGKSKGLGR